MVHGTRRTGICLPTSARIALAGKPMTLNTLQYSRKWLFREWLLADAQFLNDGFVAFGIRLSEVIEQATTLAHHHEKTAPGGVVLLMRLEMLRQLANPCAQDGDLHLRRTGIVIGSPVIGNQGGFFLSC